ncbi:MAG: hypothetical protein ACI9DC_004982 [Gammaproteobacteria bacterium]|jgi:hypothetical protein
MIAISCLPTITKLLGSHFVLAIPRGSVAGNVMQRNSVPV